MRAAQRAKAAATIINTAHYFPPMAAWVPAPRWAAHDNIHMVAYHARADMGTRSPESNDGRGVVDACSAQDRQGQANIICIMFVVVRE